MAFMKKADMLAAAEALGVNLEGLSWPEQQKAVREAIEASGESFFNRVPKPEPETPKRLNDTKSLQERMAESIKGSKPILLSERYDPVRNQLIKYSEYLGEEVKTRDVSYLRDGIPDGTEHGFGGYVIQGKSGRKVFGLTSIPQMNVRIYFDPDKHWYAPIVEDYDGRKGYIWKHPMYRGIKQLLIESGYYDNYADQFDGVKHPRNIWCAGGKIWAVDIPLVERIFRDVQKKAAKDE